MDAEKLEFDENLLQHRPLMTIGKMFSLLDVEKQMFKLCGVLVYTLYWIRLKGV